MNLVWAGDAGADEWRFGSVLLDARALGAAQVRDAAELLAHLNEASFGYRSDDPGRPSPSEPRAGYDPHRTTRRDRLVANAAGLGCSAETLQEAPIRSAKRARRAGRPSPSAFDGPGPEIGDRLRAAILAEAQGLAESSDVRKMQFRARVASRLARERDDPFELPSWRQTFNQDRR